MTEEELLREAAALGEMEGEELTFGELQERMERAELRQRRWLQQLSLLAYRHAVLVAQALAGQRLPAVEEVFPFWSEEELQQLRLSRCRSMMERLAAQSSGKECGNETTEYDPPGTGEGTHSKRA